MEWVKQPSTAVALQDTFRLAGFLDRMSSAKGISSSTIIFEFWEGPLSNGETRLANDLIKIIKVIP